MSAGISEQNERLELLKKALAGDDESLRILVPYMQWTDIVRSALQGKANAEMTIEKYLDTDFIATFFSHNQNDQISFTYQFPHNFFPSTIKMHAHVVPMGLASGNVKYGYQYKFVSINDTIDLKSTWTEGTVIVPVTENQYRKAVIHPIVEITPPASVKSVPQSAILLFMLSRLGTDNGDTYTESKDGGGTATANLCLLEADVHYQMLGWGTNNEYSNS